MGIPCCCRPEGCCLAQEPTCWLIEVLNANNDCAGNPITFAAGYGKWWVQLVVDTVCVWGCTGDFPGTTPTLRIFRDGTDWWATVDIGVSSARGTFRLDFTTSDDCWQPEQITLACTDAPGTMDAADLTCRITPYFEDDEVECHDCCYPDNLCAIGHSPASFVVDIPAACFSGMYVLERSFEAAVGFDYCRYRYVDGDVTIELLPILSVGGPFYYFVLQCIRYVSGSGGSLIQDLIRYRMSDAFLAQYENCRQCPVYEDIEMVLLPSGGFFGAVGACDTPSATDPAFVTAVPLA